MTAWPPLPDAIERPAYRSLAQHVAAAIEAGHLMPGDRLPTQRDLAWRLGLSVQTVSRAYDALTRSGLIAGEVGRGTFVTPRPDDEVPPYHRFDRGEQVIDCSMLTPVIGPVHSSAISRTLADLAQRVPASAFYSFRPREALNPHVEAALPWLARCGVRAGFDQVVPTNGNASALTTALMTAASPGDIVAVESPGHHIMPNLCRALGLRLVGLPVDREGIDPDALSRLCRTQPVRAVHVMPGGQGATACVAGPERRREICRIARRHGVWLLENDAWGPLEVKRPPPLATLAPELTFYFTGLTKCLLPGLRHGWLVAPDAQASSARARHLATNWMATALTAQIAASWLQDGTAETLLAWQRRALARRNQRAGALLGGLPHQRAARGLHVWLPVPEPREADYVAEARSRGVALTPGSAFTVDGAPGGGVRLCLGAVSPGGLDTALSVAAELLTRGVPTA